MHTTRPMQALLIITGGGPLLILSSHASLTDPVLLGKLKAKGIDKFIAYPLPMETVKTRYGGHFQVTMNDLHETDDLRVLDYDGQRIFKLFSLKELGTPFIHEPDPTEPTRVFMD